MIEKLMKLALLGSEWVLYLLLILSVVSIATMVERFIYFVRRRGEAEQIRSAIEEHLPAQQFDALSRKLDEMRSVEADVVRVALKWFGSGPEALSDAVESHLARNRATLERGSNLLGTLGNNAPFVGLFGTVLGVIIAFHALGDSGGNPGEMGGVMAGIAEALVATGVGLFVALPAVVAYNLLQQTVGNVEGNVESLVKLMSAHAKAAPETVARAQRWNAERGSVAKLPVAQAGKKRSKPQVGQAG